MKLAQYLKNKSLDFDLALGDAESKRYCATSCTSTDRQSSVKGDLAPILYVFLVPSCGHKEMHSKDISILTFRHSQTHTLITTALYFLYM